MKRVVLATSNPHKVEEINAVTKNMGIEFVLPPKGFDPVENGKTFEENALIKAKEANKLTGMPSLADDSGLCVDALDGIPGIQSARYAKTQDKRIERLLEELKGVSQEKRGAKFVCAMVLVDKNGEVLFSDTGECFGSIGFGPKGKNGFGYDPVFILKNSTKTMAELTEKEKNKISHRGQALNRFIKFISHYSV